MMIGRRGAQSGRMHLVMVAVVIALLVVGWEVWRSRQAGELHVEGTRTQIAQGWGMGAEPAAGASDLDRASQQASSAAQDRKHMLAARLAMAELRLASYQMMARYPPQSQPIGAHADVARPFEPVIDIRPLLSAQGEPVAGRHLVSSQDRIYVSGHDSVLFTVSMRDDQNHAAPLRVTRATAHEVQDVGHVQTVAQVAVQFEDRGSHGDSQANDGVYTARLQPSSQGFANTQGTIRVDLDLQSDAGGMAHAFFDIIYMPNVPATWAGSVREVMNQGSLDFYVKADVREAGRYIVTARAYDATGKAFALLSFNDEVPAGAAEFRLSLFGKLVRDAKPVFPITLRDMEGYVLYDSRFPDRAMMPRGPQLVYTSRAHAISEFADAPWDSEQKQRYLSEYDKDVQQARQDVAGLPAGLR